MAKRGRTRSRRYQTVAGLVEKNKLYPINEALSLLAKLKTARFDETVELHINTIENGISGTLTLPHGTGKKTRVAIADPSTSSGQVQLDELLKKIEKGKIDFDVLLATPDVMPKLAKVAKFLGPRGLMPNPKNGTITDKPAEAAKKYEGGQTSFKTESKTPIIHLSLGKISFGEKKLMENIVAVLKALPSQKVKNATLKLTMSPGIKIKLD
ncbi:MAG: 50S ribosomal protein L1 [Candidatus Levybacteria bacterium]|nr:50S ribosomal protein L1 [Candidatus Levybacteria bacterium]